MTCHQGCCGRTAALQRLRSSLLGCILGIVALVLSYGLFTVSVSERETDLDLVDRTLHSEGNTCLLYTAILGGWYNLQV